MTLIATGTGLIAKADHTFDVTYEVRDEQGKLVARRMVTATTLADLKTQVNGELQALRNAQTDAALNAAIVGQVLASL